MPLPSGAPRIDVVVVGAGAAGLMAARELKRAGKTVLVLEASARVGGRVRTRYDTGAGMPVELGPEFVHGEAPETTRLLDEARLVTVPVLGTQYRAHDGALATQEPIAAGVAQLFARLARARGRDRSFQDFLDDAPGGRRLARERALARSFVQGFEAADTRLISARSLADQGDPTAGASEARRIVKGQAALIEHLHRDVADDVRLNTRVARVAREASRVRVFDAAGREHRARAVVVTVALPLLQQGRIVFEPEIPATLHAAQRLVMGHALRVNVVVRERFWEAKADEVGYVHAPTRPFNVWWTQHPLRAPLIVGWSGGPPALALTHAGDAETAALRELARAFGLRRARLEQLVDAVHFHDWTLDPFTLGAYSYAGVGGATAARALARAVDHQLFFAGEATASDAGGTVEGALASGRRAARRILAG